MKPLLWLIILAYLVVMGFIAYDFAHAGYGSHAYQLYTEPCLWTTASPRQPCPKPRPQNPCLFPPGGVVR